MLANCPIKLLAVRPNLPKQVRAKKANLNSPLLTLNLKLGTRNVATAPRPARNLKLEMSLKRHRLET
jgi:hypothetical protein